MISKVTAEFIGTFAIIFFGCGSMLVAPAATPFIFGLAVATMIYTVGHISGAHFNPAVTLAFTITRHFPLRQVLPYWFAQFGGSIVAAATLSFFFPDASNYGATIPSVQPTIAFAWEVLLSFFLMFVIIAVATDTRAEGIMAGVAIGGIVALCALIGGQFSGASMNPARTLGPAIFSHHYDALWIYFTAPFLGAMIGAFVYQKIRCEPGTKNVKGCC